MPNLAAVRERGSISREEKDSLTNFDCAEAILPDVEPLAEPLRIKHQYVPGSGDNVRSMEALQTFLQTVPFFFCLTAKQISRLPLKIREFGAMNVVIEEGQILEHVYILASGTIEVMNSKKGMKRIYGHRRIASISAPNVFGIDDVIFGAPSEFTFHASTETTLLLIHKQHLFELFGRSPLFANNVSNRMLHTLPAFRVFQDLCKTIFGAGVNSQQGYLLPLRSIVETYKSSGTIFHKLVNSPEIDTQALLYCLKRLPQNITTTYGIILSTYLPGYLVEETAGDDAVNCSCATLPVDTGKRRRCAWTFGKSGQTIIIMRDSFTDIIDFVSNLCILVVESEKIRMRLRQLVSPSGAELLKEALSLSEADEAHSSIIDYLPFSKKELSELRQIWGSKFYSELSNIASHREDYTIRMESLSGRKFCEDPYSSWGLALLRQMKRKLGLADTDDLPEDIVIDVMFSNNRVLKQLFCTRQEDFKELIEKMMNKMEGSQYTWKNDDDRYYKILTYLLEKEPVIRDAYRLQLELNGFTLLEDAHSSALIVDMIDVSKIRPSDTDSALYDVMCKASERAQNGRKHFIVNVDKTFGGQIEAILRALLLMFGDRINSVNLTGKASGLVGSRGDIVIPSKILLSKQTFGEDSTDEIRLCNSSLTTEVVEKCLHRSTSAKIHRGVCITVPGFVFQSESVLQFYKVVHGCTAVEMQSSYVKRQLEECRRTGIISTPIKNRYLFYFTDMPFGNEDGSEIRMMKNEMIATTFATIRSLLYTILSD